jgi:hypothetical protein
MIYRPAEAAPENEKVSVVWGKESANPGYGTALRLGNRWYIYGQSNPHANGRVCARPDGWLPKNRDKWTDDEKRLLENLCREVLSPKREQDHPNS